MRIPEKDRRFLEKHYSEGMTAEELARVAGSPDWLVHAFLAEVTFQETAVFQYRAGLPVWTIALALQARTGQVYYQLHKVMKRLGLRWLRQLRKPMDGRKKSRAALSTSSSTH